MKKSVLPLTLAAFFFVQLYETITTSGTGKVYAQTVKEKTLEHEGSTITVRLIAKADVVKVKPYIKAKKGKKKGSLICGVTIKNTGSDPQRYAVYCQGRKKSGGWEGGAAKKFPKKGKLGPGEEKTVKVRTGFKAKAVPKEIRVEIFPPL